MKFPSLLLASAIVISSMCTSQTHAAVTVSDGELTAEFSVSTPTIVPGKTLKAGSYSIRVLDHLSDRVLLQIEDSKGKAQTKFLAVPNKSLSRSAGNGPITYAEAKHAPNSLRGYSFPGGSTVEFVYPKAQAANIAQVNGASVLAIDPASEGRPVATKLSKDDLELVTLWTLSPTRVGPQGASVAGIQAQRYDAVRADPPTPPSEVAALGTMPHVLAPRGFVAPSSTSSRVAGTVNPAHIKQARHSVALTALPHTASNLPLLFLLGLVSLLAAMASRARRALTPVRA